ncbi:hypothetical protein JCM5353_001891 [Sporobolomyces roseus]
MTFEELVDRLVVAVDEQDVLYTLHWLKQIKDGDYSEQLINNKHSWKGYSALESIIQSPFSQLRQFILQMLLLQGVDYRSKEMLDLAMEWKNLEVLGMILTWDVKGKETAGDAARLFDLSLQEAGDWIDQNLPTPPNFDSLTGFKPLPAPPSPRSIDSSDSIGSPIEPLTPQITNQEETVFVKEEESNAPSLRDLSPSSYTTQHKQRDCSSSSLSPIPSSSVPPPFENPFQLPSPIKREGEQDPQQPFRLRSSLKRSQGRQSSLFNARPLHKEEEPISSLISFDSPVRLCLRRLPFGFTPQDVSSLLASIGVECNVYNCHTEGMPAYAFVQVEQDQVSKCLAELDQRQVKHCRISCHVATPDRNPRRSFSQQQQHPKWSPPQIDPFFSNFTSSNLKSSSSTLSTLPSLKEYNLLILNLPLNETLEARQFLSNLPAYSIHLLPSHAQAVAFLRLTSEEKSDEIKSLWNLCVVDGKCLEVVDAKNGLSGREAVEAHFGLSESQSAGRDNGKGKRRMSQEEMFEACRKQGKKSRYSI